MEKFWRKIEEFNFEKIEPQFKALLAIPLIFWFICMVSNASNLILQNKNRLKMETESEYNGKVFKKGLDKNNRNTPYLVLENKSLYHEDSIVWSKVDVGDSLIKT